MVRKILKDLAGTDEIKDPEVFRRYQELNVTLLDTETNPAGMLDRLMELRNLKNTDPKPAIPLGPVFQDDEAACVPASDHDVTYARKKLETFFTERGVSTAPARAICMGCLAIDRCLDFALSHNIQFGMWGGTSVRQRKVIKATFDENGTDAAIEVIVEQREKSRRRLGVEDPFLEDEEAAL